MTFAKFIKSVLEQTGLTNYKLAKLLEVSQTTVANWANGATEPHDKKRAEVLALFGVSETDLKLENIVIEFKQETPSTPEGEGLSVVQQEALNFIKTLTDEQLRRFIAMGRAAFENREEP